MRYRLLHAAATLLGAAAALVAGRTVPAAAQAVSAASLKAAFVANFAKFTEWPVERAGEPRAFQFCVVGDRAVAVALEETLHAHPSAAPMSVTFLKSTTALPRCDLLYVSGVDVRETARLVDSLKGTAVFTVSDTTGFAERGGVAQLVEVDGRMRFSINAAAAQRNHLALNARLLTLATLVKDTDGSR